MRTATGFATIFALLTVSALVSAQGIPATVPGDAPFDLTSTAMDSVITCVGGLENVTNPYLLGEYCGIRRGWAMLKINFPLFSFFSSFLLFFSD